MYTTAFIKKYRLSTVKKMEIAKNLIACIVDDNELTNDTEVFIELWCITGNRYKKTFTDVWNMVLDRFVPSKIPLLYRACDKNKTICEGRIASYSGRFEAICNFKRDKIIILNTDVALKGNNEYDPFVFSFFPLFQVMKKYNIATDKISEEEYIVRETYSGAQIFKKIWASSF